MTFRTTQLLALLTALLLLVAGCDRGDQPAMVGKAAPDFTINDGSRSLSLHDYRGKTVVLNFWATWCPPCVEEMPSLLKMQQQLKGNNVVVLAVSVDVDKDAYNNFLTKHGITDITVVRDPDEKVPDIYGSHMWPESYIIDKNGVVQRKVIGATDWTAPDMENYLAKL